MLTKSVTKRIELGHEPGDWIEVRPLSWRDLEGAKDRHQNQLMARAADLGDALKALQGLSSDQQAAAQKEAAAKQNPSDLYDVGYLLHRAIVDWSYGEPVTEEAIDSLDQQTVDVVLAELLPKTSEADLKNGYSPSISPLKATVPSVEAG